MDNKHNSLNLALKISSDICPWTLSVPRSSQCSLLGTDNVRGQISEHIFAPNEGYCLYSARPRKIPGWIVFVRENISANKRTSRKYTIEIVLSGFLSVFFFKFYIWLSNNSIWFLNRCAYENLVMNNRVFMSQNYRSENCLLEIWCS